jgi:hypothetical protein
MVVDYPTISEPATAEYVLEVLRDIHRHAAQIDSDADSQTILTFETTIDDWQEAMGDALSWRDLGRWMNEQWNINLTDDIWQHVLEPGKTKRLSDLCQIIAHHARQPQVLPAQLLGTTCTTAGAFLTVRSILKQSGADASKIAPSTLLESYARRYYQQFLSRISPLAPGALPPIKIRYPFYANPIWGILIGLVCMVIGMYSSSVSLLFTVGGAVVLVLSIALSWFAVRWRLPTNVEFGKLKTFRDLAEVIAKGRRTGELPSHSA